MVIKESASYSIKEASELLNINSRTLTRLAVKLGIEKIDNRYIFEGIDLIKYSKDNNKDFINYDDVVKELHTVKTERDKLLDDVKLLSDDVKMMSNNKKEYDDLVKELDTIKTERDKLLGGVKLLSDDRKKQEQIIQEINNDDYVLLVLKSIRDDKHLEEFTNEEYNQFRDRLKEANFLENRIKEYKEEIIRMEEYILDYRNNIEYLKKSLDKRAEETAILLKSIEQRTYIEAREKKLDQK